MTGGLSVPLLSSVRPYLRKLQCRVSWRLGAHGDGDGAAHRIDDALCPIDADTVVLVLLVFGNLGFVDAQALGKLALGQIRRAIRLSPILANAGSGRIVPFRALSYQSSSPCIWSCIVR
jgi:hypothetical protein